MGIKAAGQGKLYARRHIAEALTISERRVRQLTEEGVLTEHSHGHYRLLPSVQAYIGYLQSQVSDDDEASDYNVEKARLTRAKREDAELELQLKRNELHRAQDVEFVMTGMLTAFKAKLVTLPHKILPGLMAVPDGEGRADAFVKLLAEAFGDALAELAGYSPDQFSAEKYLASLEEKHEGGDARNESDG